MQVTGQSDRATAPASLNTVAARINRRLEWWYASGLAPPCLGAYAGFEAGAGTSTLVAALLSFAAFVLTLAFWYRAVLRPVSGRHAQVLATAFGGLEQALLETRRQWPLVQHALQIYQNQSSGSSASSPHTTPTLSGNQEK